MIWIALTVVICICLIFIGVGADSCDTDMVGIGAGVLLVTLAFGLGPSTAVYLTNDAYIADYEQYITSPSHHIPDEDIRELQKKMYRLQTDNRGVWQDGLIPDRVMGFVIKVYPKAKEK